MKVLSLVNQKGGVGKSMIATQYAFYLSQNKRVLFIDLDHQANSTRPLTLSQIATIYPASASDVLAGKHPDIALDEGKNLLLVKADDALLSFEKQGSAHGSFATNLRRFMALANDKFDYCIIDTNPNPDIRVTASMIAATHVISPVQMNQEAISGIGGVVQIVKGVKVKLNPALDLIGIMPNLFEATSPFQRNNFLEIVKHYSRLLIALDGGKHAVIPKRSVFAEAQAEGIPVWKMPKTSARDAWKEIEPIFEAITKRMEGE